MKKVEAFQSDDGSLFIHKEDCANYDGLHYKCGLCGGTGTEIYEHRIPYPSGLPDSGWVDDTIEKRSRTCTRCNGIGYQQQMDKENDPEWVEMKRLEKKLKSRYEEV